MKKSLIGFMVVLLTALAVLGSCGGGKQSAAAVSGDGPVAVTWFRWGLYQPNITYWNDTLWVKELERRLNVKIQFQGPPSGGDYMEAANVMLASGDLPDVLFYSWNAYNGGLQGAINDGIVLNYGANRDYLAKLPHWMALVNGNESVRKAVTMDDGTLAIFAQVEEDTKREGYVGFGIRQDWLDRVGLQSPSTIDELHQVLLAFKQQDANGNGDPNDEIPLTDTNGFGAFRQLIAPWGLRYNMFYPDPQNPGKLTYWTEYKNGQAFTNCLTTLAQWYREGLFEPDWLTQDDQMRTAKIVNDRVGMFFAYTGNYVQWTDALRQLRPEAKPRITGVRRLVGPEGKPYLAHDGYINWSASFGEATTISPSAEKAGKMDAILRLIDYMYSPEGTELISFGVEGVSFTKDANGSHQWTDAVTKDPNYPMGIKLFEYALPFWGSFPKIMSYEAWKLNEIADPDAAEAHVRYYTGDQSLLRPYIMLSPAEAEENNMIMTDINTAIQEFMVAVIGGERPVSAIPAFLSQVKNMGIDRAIQLNQAAYDRFIKK